MNITIKEFSIDFYKTVIELWKRSEGIGLSSADSKERIKYYLDRNPGSSFTAWDGGRLVGAVLCGHDGRRGYLHHLAVDPEYRKHGIGRKLSDACMAALGKQGIDKAHIFVYGSNQEGLTFWQKAGWYRRHELVLMSYDIDIE
jgi:ribosomal protein S18 acetylase RimI-like enzyme